MTDQQHVIEVEILPNGEIKGTVKGVTGPSCTKLSAWLDEIGKVTVDRHTADFAKPDKVMAVGQRKGGQQ